LSAPEHRHNDPAPVAAAAVDLLPGCRCQLRLRLVMLLQRPGWALPLLQPLLQLLMQHGVLLLLLLLLPVPVLLL
jgi:hypothetical protein